MKSYFKRLNSAIDLNQVKAEQIDSYRIALVSEMKKQGASEFDIGLVSDTIIINSINAGRNPKAVAWAILQ